MEVAKRVSLLQTGQKGQGKGTNNMAKKNLTAKFENVIPASLGFLDKRLRTDVILERILEAVDFKVRLKGRALDEEGR